jgi:hypothetical protein
LGANDTKQCDSNVISAQKWSIQDLGALEGDWPPWGLRIGEPRTGKIEKMETWRNGKMSEGQKRRKYRDSGKAKGLRAKVERQKVCICAGRCKYTFFITT